MVSQNSTPGSADFHALAATLTFENRTPAPRTPARAVHVPAHATTPRISASPSWFFSFLAVSFAFFRLFCHLHCATSYEPASFQNRPSSVSFSLDATRAPSVPAITIPATDGINDISKSMRSCLTPAAGLCFGLWGGKHAQPVVQ